MKAIVECYDYRKYFSTKLMITTAIPAAIIFAFANAILVIIAMAFLIMWFLDIRSFKNETTQHRDHQKAPNLELILNELSLV